MVEPAPGSPRRGARASGCSRIAATRLAGYKCPRTIDFTAALPRDPNGKLYKRKLRDPYWVGRERKI